MKEQGLVSKYTIAQFKAFRTSCNESEVGNTLNREFTQDQELNVLSHPSLTIYTGSNYFTQIEVVV